jgi:hypothetical protein
MEQPMNLLKALTFAAVLAISLVVVAQSTDRTQVPYPDGYRNWYHVKSQVATEDNKRFQSIGGIHHIYANELALQGYRAGTFPDGSVIVFDLLGIRPHDGSLIEGERRWVAVMHKDSDKYRATGGWGYDNFAGNSKTDRNVAVNGPNDRCFACHLQQEDHDYVFSKLRD